MVQRVMSKVFCRYEEEEKLETNCNGIWGMQLVFKGNLEKAMYREAYHIMNAGLFVQWKARFSIMSKIHTRKFY